MDLGTIEIDRDEAKAKLDEYRASLEHDRNAEDEAMAAAYRAASRGLPVIRMSEAIARGGWFSNGLPKLAVVRADARRCLVNIEGRWRRSQISVIYQADQASRNLGALVGKYTVRVEVPHDGTTSNWTNGVTTVPPIPPRMRPKRPWRFHVLWEVERWDLTPPKDPALVKHIGGDLWSVHAVWDLTEIERAVIAGGR